MSTIQRWQTNPILVKELRSRMRGGRAFATLTIVLILLSLFTYGLYRLVFIALRYTQTPMSPMIGQMLFAGLAILELIIVCAVTPALTANAISNEKEKLTYEMLLATPLHPGKILSGKLFSALSYVLLLIFAAVPLASLVFVFGGVTARDMFKALIVLMVVAIMFGVIGLFTSALFKSSGRATIVTYLIVVAMLFGPLFISSVGMVVAQGSTPRWISTISPINALVSALSPSLNIQSLIGPFWAISSFFWGAVKAPISTTHIPRPVYHYSVPLYLGITLLLYLLATRLVLPAWRRRITLAEALVALILLLGFTGLVALGFFATANRYENINIVAEPPRMVPFMVEPAVPVLPLPEVDAPPIPEPSNVQPESYP